MPMMRNTSSSGAPKRSASRLDRMPAMTRTAPSRMAMLTESREAMKTVPTGYEARLWHPYRRHGSTPTHFPTVAAICPISGRYFHVPACRIDGVQPSIEESFACTNRAPPGLSKLSGHERHRHHRFPAVGGTLGRRGIHLALVLLPDRGG